MDRTGEGTPVSANTDRLLRGAPLAETHFSSGGFRIKLEEDPSFVKMCRETVGT
jgi:hypothetical protein